IVGYLEGFPAILERSRWLAGLRASPLPRRPNGVLARRNNIVSEADGKGETWIFRSYPHNNQTLDPASSVDRYVLDNDIVQRHIIPEPARNLEDHAIPRVGVSVQILHQVVVYAPALSGQRVVLVGFRSGELHARSSVANEVLSNRNVL